MMNTALVEWTRIKVEARKDRTNQPCPQLAQLTIVIPSFCRQEYLLRQLAYWAYSDATIIIIDGSPTPLEVSVMDLISGVPNVQYLSDVDSYINRIRKASKLIKTPYAMCLADDDIFLMGGLCLAVDNLNQEGTVVACMGQAMAVEFDNTKKLPYIFPYGDSLENYQVKHLDPAKRIRIGIDKYRSATSYAVFRTATFKEVWSRLGANSCLTATEYEHAITTYMLGDLATSSGVYWLRSFECEPVDSVIDGTRKTDFHAWWTQQDFREEREAFVTRLAAKLGSSASLSERDAREVILEVIGYILVGRHTGLMNESLSITAFALVGNWIKSFSSLHLYFIKFKSTGLGRVLRNKIMARIRGAKTVAGAITKLGMTDQTFSELRAVLLFISEFHATLELTEN